MLTNIYQAKTNLSRLIERVLKGEEIIIGKMGKPVAKLVPYRKQTAPLKPGALKNKIIIKQGFDAQNKLIETMFYD